MNVVIVAGGLGTRFKQLSVLPKLLLPLPTESSIIKHDLKIFENNPITVIINERFYDMFVNYIKINNLQNIEVISTTNCNGSYNTISSVLHKLPQNDVLFVWSDLVFEYKFQKFNVNDNIVFTDNKGNYRYEFANGIITKLNNAYNGNIPGVYFIKNLKEVFKTNTNAITNYDLVDAICASNVNFTSVELDNSMIECKDLDTYVNYMHTAQTSNTNQTRFFNKLTHDKNDNTLLKQAIDKEYIHIIKKEHAWYKSLNELHLHNQLVPNVKNSMEDESSFKMQYLNDYETLNAFRKHANTKDIDKVYNTIFKYIDELSNNNIIVSINTFKEDLYKEIVGKVLDRCDKIKYMLIKYDKTYLKKLLMQVYNYILLNYKDDELKYSFCHGDLNGSNILINPTTLDVKFIDPRGYFGNTTLYGWLPYELAKIRYSLCGYDDFNNLPQVYTVDTPKIDNNISLQIINDKIGDKIYKLLVGVIYVALAGYISQDINKANIAYEFGIDLLEKNLLY